MCVIACSPRGVQFPDENTIRKMWYANDDGAGFCYEMDGRVHIEKGFMNVEDFIKAVNALEEIAGWDTPAIFHFRIGTAGGNTAQNTHPFPIENNYGKLKELSYIGNLAVAHNGCIPIDNDIGVSDTMTYIKNYMSLYRKLDKHFYQNKIFQRAIEEQTKSKLAFLDEKGTITTIGNFTEIDGILYSNTYWQFRGNRASGSYHSYGGWVGNSIDDDDDDDYTYRLNSSYRWCSDLNCYIYKRNGAWHYFNAKECKNIPVPDKILEKMHLKDIAGAVVVNKKADLKFVSEGILNYVDDAGTHQSWCTDAYVDKYGTVYFEGITGDFYRVDENMFITDTVNEIQFLDDTDWFNNTMTIVPSVEISNTVIYPLSYEEFPDVFGGTQTDWWTEKDADIIDNRKKDELPSVIVESKPNTFSIHKKYYEGDVVEFNGEYYRAKAFLNSANINPDLSTAWEEVAVLLI